MIGSRLGPCETIAPLGEPERLLASLGARADDLAILGEVWDAAG